MSSGDEPAIEVIGSAQYSLKPVEYRVRVSLDAKSGFSELGKSHSVSSGDREKVMKAIVERVISEGFPEKDIIFGGRMTYQKWQGKKGNETREADHLTFRSDDDSVAIMIPLWLEEVDTGRLSMTFQTLPTIYEEPSGPEIQASSKALENARAKAEAIAKAESIKLGALLMAQDMRLAKRAPSHNHPMMAGGEALRGGLGEHEFGEAVETRVIEFRAKYAIAQWILQQFEDTEKLAEALDRLGLPYTWHKVVPFVGELMPEPVVSDPDSVVMFGSYSLWRNAEAHGYRPGVFKVTPFVEESVWHPHLLNGADSQFITLRDIPGQLVDDGRILFVRPVSDAKEEAGKVKTTAEIIATAESVMSLNESDIPNGSLRHDTELMFSTPVSILKEWRLWAVAGQIVTYSLYKEGRRVVYRQEIDDDALAFAQKMVDLNPDYSPAYVIDVCRTEEGLKLLETNCLNAAGFYAADLVKLAAAIDGMARD